MIPTPTPQAHNVSSATAEDTIRLALDTKNFSHIISLLTDLYENPVAAVVREYSTNAWDSHQEAGVSRPIEITLPTRDDPIFKVRDFGVGLSVDDLRAVYSLYGASTKRESDAVTGMLGLGCKSALTYGPTFTVTSVKDGVRIVAVVAKDTDGVGTIRIIDTCATNEGNGVEVAVPVRPYDINMFAAEVGTFFSYWREDNAVLIDGEPPRLPYGKDQDEPTLLWLDDDVVVQHGARSSFIVQGGVAYPVRYDNNWKIPGFVAWVPIGTVDFTPSREALQETPRTVDVIHETKTFITARFDVALEKKLASKTNPWDKAIAGHSWGRSQRLYLTAPNQIYRRNYRDQIVKVGRTLGFDHLRSGGTIVTHYPHLSIPPVARERIKLACSVNTLLVPVGADLSVIEGRPNVKTWDEIVAATQAHVDAQKKVRTKVVNGVYEYRHNGRAFNGVLDASLPIVLVTKGDQGPFTIDKTFPEAQVVILPEHRQAKFTRIYPTAVTWYEYYSDEVRKALAALTEADKVRASGLSTVLTKLCEKADDIQDQTFTEIRKLTKTGVSPAWKRCQDLNTPIPKSTVVDKVIADYPLIKVINSYDLKEEVIADLISYANHKYTTTNGQES